jgi:hypothetical protein
MAAPNRRFSMQDVHLPPNLLKDIDIERMGSLSEDEGAFMEFLDSLDLEGVRRTALRGKLTVSIDACSSIL